MNSLLGKTIGKYYITKRLGRGGMAEVYQAYQAGLSRYVAIKVIHSHLAEDPAFIERFEREALALAQLRHPNIVHIFDFDLADGMYYILMEYIAGPTLQAELAARRQRNEPFSLTEIAHLFTALAGAIDYAHSRGVIHRDIKPGNVMFTADGQAVLTDFGIIHLMNMAGYTELGAVAGTPAYMSPEQAGGEPVTPRSDIYSLGVMLYETVVGQRPFEADSKVYLLMKHLSEPPPPPSAIKADIPAAVETTILRALSKNPADRQTTAGQLADQLRQAVGLSAEAILAAALAPPTPPVAVKLAVTPTVRLPAEKPQPGPPEPARPPVISGFVGRTAELTAFARQLTEMGQVVISGMAGVGKTALAAALIKVWQVWQADRPPVESVTSLSTIELDTILAKRDDLHHAIFWHAFHPEEGLMALIWKLAAFLARYGQPDLWQMLDSARQAGSEPPPVETLLDYLAQLLRGQNVLLCLDDFQHIEADPLVKIFIGRLQPLITTGNLSLIITARRVPGFIRGETPEPLAGLSPADIGLLTAGRGIDLAPEHIAYLHAQTEGNAELLTLTLNALRRADNPERLLKHLADNDDIERYLMAEVDAGLSDDEREVMESVAVLLGYPAGRNAIETVLDGGGIRRMLRDLTDRYLLLLDKRDLNRVYFEHAMVQTFYYDTLSRRRRRAMHRLAGEYYETEEPDRLKAAIHYQRAGEAEKAAMLATADVWSLINQGQARPLHNLLSLFSKRDMPADLWAAVNLALGEVCGFLQETAQADERYHTALETGRELPDSPAKQELTAKICGGLSDLRRDSEPAEAIDWLEQGLAAAPDGPSDIRADLLLKLSTLQLHSGQFHPALETIEQAAAALPGEDSWLWLGVWVNRGLIFWKLGNLPEAIAATERGLPIVQKLHNPFREVLLWNNLGIYKDEIGDWPGAAEMYRQALALSKELNQAKYQLVLGSNMAFLLTKLGRFAEARSHFEDSLRLAREFDLKTMQVQIQSNLADLFLRQGRVSLAEAVLSEVDELAAALDFNEERPAIERSWAQLHLLRREAAEALRHAERAVTAGREMETPLEEGSSLRVLALSHLASGDTPAAEAAFAGSLALLQETDPYEAARTRFAWGRYLYAGPDGERGRSLLEQARQVFTRLGAARDSAAVDAVLE